MAAHKSYYRRFISRNIADDYLRTRGIGARREIPSLGLIASSRRRRADEPISPFPLFRLSRRRSPTIERHVRLGDHGDISRGHAYMRRGVSRTR